MSENVYQSVMVALTYQAKLIQFNTAINALLPQFAKKKKETNSTTKLLGTHKEECNQCKTLT